MIIEFLADDVDGEHQSLHGLVEDLITEPTTMPWGNRSLLLRDPDGDLVNFFTPVARGARRAPPSASPANGNSRLAACADKRRLRPADSARVVDEPVPGGLSLPQMEGLIRAVTAWTRITAATIAAYTPARDHQNQTLAADLRILELIAQHAAPS